MSEPRQPSVGDRDRRELAEVLYDEARSLPVDARSGFIEDACRGDHALRSELEDLLQHADAAGSFFELLADAVTTPRLTAAPVASRYEIQACIGVGGMGTVYRARDTRLQRDVALKFLPPCFAAAPDAEELMLQEARAAAALVHDNVCTVHEIATAEDGRPFISMAFYDGETLKDRLLRGAIPVGEAVAIARQVARGLAAAHAQRIVHRDVKPGNVMILRDGTVKLLDFGLAKPSDVSVTGRGVTPGTVAYMSPEQVSGDTVGPRSDLFSLGVVLYEMIAGVHPFRGGNQQAVIQAILHNRPEVPQTRTAGAPASLERVLTRLLDKEPASRYASADQLVADLATLMEAAPLPMSQRSDMRRMPRAALLGAFVFMFGGAAFWLAGRGPNRTPASAAAMSMVRFAGVESPEGTKTIAVLPFTNVSRDPDEDYLIDGLTEELIGVLSHVRALRVVARTSAFAFKESNRDIREIGRALDVATVLEGSVQKSGDRIRVRAQLINVADGLHLWSESYDSETTDIFALQRDLALRIAAALEAGLSPAERERVVRRATANTEAFALYLKGRHFWNQRTSGAYRRAHEYFERAIEADSQYASAHAGLAAVYSLQGLSGDMPPAVARERMRAAALKAVQLDDSLAEGHAVLGAYMHVYEWDSEAAEREQLRAIELDPSHLTARYFYGNLLRSHGRIEEALAQYNVATELDPLDPLLRENLGRTLMLAGRFDEAREHFDGALELDSTFWRLHTGLGLYFETTGRLDDALRAYRRTYELAGERSTDIARMLARLGEEQEARRIVRELEQQAARTALHDPDVATVLLALDDLEGALDWLERSFGERHPQLRFIGGDPTFKPFEVEPRYRELLRRIGVRR